MLILIHVRENAAGADDAEGEFFTVVKGAMERKAGKPGVGGVEFGHRAEGGIGPLQPRATVAITQADVDSHVPALAEGVGGLDEQAVLPDFDGVTDELVDAVDGFRGVGGYVQKIDRLVVDIGILITCTERPFSRGAGWHRAIEGLGESLAGADKQRRRGREGEQFFHEILLQPPVRIQPGNSVRNTPADRPGSQIMRDEGVKCKYYFRGSA